MAEDFFESQESLLPQYNTPNDREHFWNIIFEGELFPKLRFNDPRINTLDMFDGEKLGLSLSVGGEYFFTPHISILAFINNYLLFGSSYGDTIVYELTGGVDLRYYFDNYKGFYIDVSPLYDMLIFSNNGYALRNYNFGASVGYRWTSYQWNGDKGSKDIFVRVARVYNGSTYQPAFSIGISHYEFLQSKRDN